MAPDLARPACCALWAALVAAAIAAACVDLREPPPAPHRSSCTTCHGSADRDGDEVARSAPPFDLAGRTDVSARGVGAHRIHLQDSPTHAAVACEQCHVVPEATESPGHADTALPAEVTFGALARASDHQPFYDSNAVSCRDTYCHGGHDVGWIPSQTTHPPCGGCHGMPPPAPHPANGNCSLCHGETVDENRQIIAPGKHVDGVVQAAERCDLCHGAGEDGAPPPDLSGSTDPTHMGVGAHARHLAGGDAGRPVGCAECHVVPVSAGDPGHLDASPHAEVILTGVALAGGRAPEWSRNSQRCADTWCHGPSASAPSPRWIAPQTLSCTGCHGMPPLPPHPQMTACALCHAEIVDANDQIIARERHVDGIVDVAVPAGCDGCHGANSTGLPPPALDGSTATSAPGVGAHARHVIGTGLGRPVLCGECHRVPATLLDPGHVDTPRPAELTFSGVAVAFGASPEYDGARCADTWCHGGRTAFGFPSGGHSSEPLWTQVDGSQTDCTGCHGMPPPTPAHPPPPVFCSGCHTNVTGLADFIDPLLHVNGTIDF